MGKVNYAAIDIGSNAVRLLIKIIDREAVQEKKIKKVMMLRVPLRLGFDVFSIGELSEKKADKLRRLMKAFRQLMKIYDVDDYRACATSAMRDARNGRTIIKKIEKDTGIRIEIIDGQEEARMIYNNHIECMEDRLGNYMYVDVGGGSTEINLLTNGELVWSVSYNIGTVRMLSNAVKEGTWQQMEEELMKVTEGVAAINIIGSGGNINKLFRLADKKDKKLQRLPVSSLQTVYDVLKPLTPEERVEAFSLKQDRADVIVPAAEIFLKIAEVVHAEYIYVPVIGLSDGIIDNLYAKSLEKEMKAE
ncbi:Ppx/GppA family phosphatase [Bacteroides cellulosilyticus]|uniref:Ppx/GppA family phosphatase n=1 Tax=Bacteroides cellulosilyticus TaxID=246787 RepID=A0A6L3JQD2_9BACE|nr:Ppx/GppA family phosphatase [Bacteroides cellulosilyticus]KAA5409561.1 Ppx/GppA family phosphatase [Bacteroides cellulosilyticus]